MANLFHHYGFFELFLFTEVRNNGFDICLQLNRIMSDLIWIAQSPLEEGHVMELSTLLNVGNEKLPLDGKRDNGDAFEHLVCLRISRIGRFKLHLSVKFIPISQENIYFGVFCGYTVFHTILHVND